MIFIKVMFGIAIIVAPFQIRHCLKQRQIPIRTVMIFYGVIDRRRFGRSSYSIVR